MKRRLRREGKACRPWPRLPWFWPFGREVPAAVWGRLHLPARTNRRLSERLQPGLDEHALIQCARQWATGRLLWHVRYVCSKRFRWDEEKAAWSAWLEWRVRSNRLPSAEERAALVRLLAGASYGCMTGREQAARFVEAALCEAERKRLSRA